METSAAWGLILRVSIGMNAREWIGEILSALKGRSAAIIDSLEVVYRK